MKPIDSESSDEEMKDVNRMTRRTHLPAILPPSPELVKTMEEASKKCGVTYEQALTQTRNSLKDRPPSERASKPS